MKEFLKRHIGFLSFALCIILGSLIVIPNTIMGNGIFRLISDFNYQQIPFSMYMNYAIKNKEIFYTFYNGLGSGFIETFSFYNLFSPFMLFSFLFPKDIYPYIISVLIIFKYGFCGLFSYMFLSRYVKRKEYAVLGSLLYTFSGFQLTSMLFHFQDAIVFFPLLLYSLDKNVYDNKKYLFCLSLIICSFTNWFFFIGEAIFIFIYFIIKIITKEYEINKNIFISLLIESICGVGISCFILLPVFFFTISNPRLGTNWNIISIIKHPFVNYLELLRAMFIFPDTMVNRLLIDSSNYNSVEIYLPVVGLLFVIPYILNNKKSSTTYMVIISLLFMFVPILNSVFTLFNTHYYARWFFMPILFLSLATIKTFENNYSIKSGLLFIIGGIITFIILFTLYYFYKRLFIGNYLYIFIQFIITCIGFVLSYLFYKYYKNHFIKLLIILILIFVSIYGNLMIYKYKGNRFIVNDNYESIINSNLDNLSNIRVYSDDSCPANISLFKNINDIHSFNTNISGGEFTFLRSLGINREVSTKIDNIDLLSFLGVKKIISCGRYSNYFNITDNDDAYNIGFNPNSYISIDEFNKLDNDNKINTIMKNVVFNDNQIKEYGYLFDKKNTINNYNFKYIKNGFIVDLDSSNDSYLIIQIPYDYGWSAYNNSKNIKIDNVDNGLIGIKINKGNNHIIFKYYPKGFKIGLIISIISLFGFGVYFIKSKVKKNKSL